MAELIRSKEVLDIELLSKIVVNLMKQNISERYKQTGEVTDEDWEFCEKIDWHPVDELSPKKEHIEELRRRLKEETPIRFNSVRELVEK